jgi:hypothetical protein
LERNESEGRRTWLKAAAALPSGTTGALGAAAGRGNRAVGAALSHVAETSDKVRGQEAIELCRKYFSDARANLSQIATLSAVFQKQERINDKLQPLNVMDLKVRKTPLSIYMQWQVPDAGQQVLWLDGAHEGKMVVSPAGWKRKLMPMLKIAPDDDMAKAVSRRPITNIGIWNFTERLAALVEEECLKDPTVAVAMTRGHEISGRPCSLFTFEHAKPSEIAVQAGADFFDDAGSPDCLRTLSLERPKR